MEKEEFGSQNATNTYEKFELSDEEKEIVLRFRQLSKLEQQKLLHFVCSNNY